MEDINLLQRMVAELNGELALQTSGGKFRSLDCEPLFKLSTCGEVQTILFCDLPLWCSEDEDIDDCDEDTPDEERVKCLQEMIRSLSNDLCHDLGKLKF